MLVELLAVFHLYTPVQLPYLELAMKHSLMEFLRGSARFNIKGTVQACGAGVNWYNRARGNWEPANICLSVNNQNLPVILNANGELQLSDPAGNLEPLSDTHSRACGHLSEEWSAAPIHVCASAAFS